MRIICYSDLHLEFEVPFTPPPENTADIMILAGDITTFADFTLLGEVLKKWNKPVLYVAGNHEFYTRRYMAESTDKFREWAADYPQLTFLQDEAITIDGVNFFGGTMWTDFYGGESYFMNRAARYMNDYRMIKLSADKYDFLHPQNTLDFHECYKEELLKWFDKTLEGSRVVISHHVPWDCKKTYNAKGDAYYAYVSLDMKNIIKEHQPVLWIHGHNHVPSDQMIGKTRLVSNPRGYPITSESFQCAGFDENGVVIEV
ncbi:MAG: metallophosphoesterase family protein [Alphaproteobacteria bacterium]|nr:metallophosphoesterase family protein [Alphaproteobacteria bacterium]